MVKRFPSLRNLWIPFVVTAFLLIPFAMYDIYYVEGREGYLRDRSFRLLAAIGDQIDALINIEADKLRAAESSFSDDAQADRILRSAWMAETFKESTFVTPWQPRAQTLKRPYNRDGLFSLQVAQLQSSFSLSLTYFKGKTQEIAETRPLDGVLKKRIEQLAGNFFDDVLIADETGRTLFQAKNFGVHAYGLSQLLENSAKPVNTTLSILGHQSSSSGSSPAPSDTKLSPLFTTASQASAMKPVTIAGTDYKLFLQPARIAIRYQQSPQVDNSLKLIVCGLWRNDRWRGESLALPYRAGIWLVLLLLATFSFSWPFVKVAYMSPKERFRARDGWHIVLSTAFAAVLVTLILSNLYYETYKSWKTEQDLKRLATEIKTRYETELHTYLESFSHLFQHPEFTQRIKALQHWDPAPLELTCSRSVDKKNPDYHKFDQVFYVDKDGLQRIKLSVKGAVTPQTSVSHFAFFQALGNGTLVDSPRDCNWKDRYQVQMLRSPNTGEFQVVIAKFHPFDGVSTDPRLLKHLAPGSALAVVTRPATLVDPVLPPGYGFAVVGQDGLVQLHSDSIRNLQENFFEESRRNPYLLASLLAAKEEPIPIEYMGQRELAYVTSLTGLSSAPLNLIVFRMSDLEDVMHVGIILFCAVLLSIPAIFLVLLASCDTLRGRRKPPGFVWPKAENTVSYAYLCLTNCICIGIFIELCVGMPSGGPGALILEAAFLILVTIALAAFSIKTGAAAFTVNGKVWTALRLNSLNTRALLVVAAGFFLLLTHIFMHQRAAQPAHTAADSTNWWESGLPMIFAVVSMVAAFYLPKLSSRHFQRTYTAAALSMLLALIVIPTIALFRASWETVDELEVRRSELTVERAVRERKSQIEMDYHSAQTSPRFIAERLGEGWYTTPSLQRVEPPQSAIRQKSAGLAAATQSNLSSLLEDFLVSRAKFCVPSGHAGAEVMESDIARMGPNERWIAGQTGLMVQGIEGVKRNTLFPAEQHPWTVPHWLPLLHLATLSALFYWIYSLIKKLFLTDSYSAPDLPHPEWKSAEDITIPHIVIGHSRSRKSAKLRCIANIPTVDLRVALNEGIKFKPWPAPVSVVGLDHFEFNIDDPDYNQRRLELIEELLYVHKYVLVIISTLDPLYYLQEGGASILSKASDPAVAAVEAIRLLDRWSRALSKFRKVELTDDSSRDFDRVKRISAGGDLVLSSPGPLDLPKAQDRLLHSGKVIVIARAKRTRQRLEEIARQLNAKPISEEIALREQEKGTDYRSTAFVAMTGFDAELKSSKANSTRLQILEELSQIENGSCILLSFVDPQSFFSNDDNLPRLSCDLESARKLRDRWMAVLDKFTMLDITYNQEVQFAAVIKNECDATAYLRRTGTALFDEFIHNAEQRENPVNPQPPQFPDKDCLVELLLLRVDSYYRVLWSSFTENERLVLYQLSRDGWINPLNCAAIQQLQRKEFISKEVPYHVMNESFRKFVLAVTDNFELQMWHREQQESSWHSLKVGLITLFIAFAAWLLYAQQELFQLSIGYLVALGGAVTTVLNMLTGFKGRSTESKK